jgi:uncharacterized protein (DUF1330 family)
MPKAYVIAAETISDQAGFAQYRPAVAPTVSPFGGNLSSVAAISQVWKASGRTRVL